MTGRQKTLILGIGNSLLQDEGAGVHAIRHLAERLPEHSDIELMDGGTLSFTLAGAIEDAENLIVIDAAQLGSVPGTTQIFVGKQMDDFVGGDRKRSVHEVSLIDLLMIARLAEQLPVKRALIGIQPRDIGWGEQPSPPVAAGIRQACDQAMQLAAEWRS